MTLYGYTLDGTTANKFACKDGVVSKGQVGNLQTKLRILGNPVKWDVLIADTKTLTSLQVANLINTLQPLCDKVKGQNKAKAVIKQVEELRKMGFTVTGTAPVQNDPIAALMALLQK